MRRLVVASIASSLLLISVGAQAASQGRYCLNELNVGTQVNCSFQTMASCQHSKTSPQDTCTPNPAATTGYGGEHKK